MKKSDVIQELVNIYPSWTKVRTDEQSIGQQFLNSLALAMEKMEKQLVVMKANQYLSTVNLDEIDLLFKIKLGPDFEFNTNNLDPLRTSNEVPTVSGLLDGTYYPVTLSEFNDIKSFWYESIPNRTSLEILVSGVDYELLTVDAQDTPATGVWNHHLGGGRVWIETTGGVQYLTFEEDKFFRGKIIVKGWTRKGTLEEETLIVPWDIKQPLTKEWEQITDISAFDIEDDVQIDVRSADFNAGPYLSVWNLKYSDNRNKIDEFWDIGHNGSIPTLDRLEYQTDEWQQLVLGFSTKETKESWELLDETTNVVSGVNITISGVDIALQPFSDRVWVATSNNKLYLYDLKDTCVSGVADLKDSTPGAEIQMDFDSPHVLLGEDIEFIPWHARPLKEIRSYRVWYRDPRGVETVLSTISVPAGTKITRSVENFVSITTAYRGEYLVVFEATFVDDEVQECRRIFKTRYKEPLVVLDLSSIVPNPIDGIDFDSDQKLWVKSSDDYYQINLHTDTILIDYDRKTLYFKEEYEGVTIDV